MNNKTETSNIVYHITPEQKDIILKYFKKENEELEEYQVCELLDKVIDEMLSWTKTSPES